MFLGFEYIKYRWKAKRRHGVHSPFLYELSDSCLQKPPNAAFLCQTTRLGELLKNNSEKIVVTDHGVGSKYLGNERILSKIYKTSSSRGKYGRFLHQLAQHYPIRKALELGTSVGVGTTCIATGNADLEITTVEGCSNTQAVAQANFDALRLRNVRSVCAVFDAFLASNTADTYDLIFIDGHHDGAALIRYVNMLFEQAHDDTFFVLDDIRWSDSMWTAWQELIADDRFHVSMDFFRMGVLLKRPKQVKQHFYIRL